MPYRVARSRTVTVLNAWNCPALVYRRQWLSLKDKIMSISERENELSMCWLQCDTRVNGVMDLTQHPWAFPRSDDIEHFFLV
jgi:hypothetical protein